MSIKILFVAYIRADIPQLFDQGIISSEHEFTRADTALPLGA